MIYKIKKADVIKAIATEPLLIDNFFALERGGELCGVCAVGAILRKALRTNNPDKISAASSVCGSNFTHGSLVPAYNNQNFFSILSCEFETAVKEASSYYGDKSGIELARFHAINVAEALCPETLKFEV